MTRLLVSVRSAEEAFVALEGGAGLIDVKEPSLGSLGRADERTIQAVVEAVAGRQPVSAALGEWVDGAGPLPDADLDYVKFGLAGCREVPHWRESLRAFRARQTRPELVFVAYADAECARAPSVEDVFDLAAQHPGSVLLLDTHCKAPLASLRHRRPTLLDWLPPHAVVALCMQCRQAGVRIALAGSLGLPEIDALLPARPDWFAVRGAVCAASDRQAGVERDRVRALVERINAARVTPVSAS